MAPVAQVQARRSVVALSFECALTMNVAAYPVCPDMRDTRNAMNCDARIPWLIVHRHGGKGNQTDKKFTHVE